MKETESKQKSKDPQVPQKTEASTKARINAAYEHLPMSFELNRGQVDHRVEYLARGRGYTLFLTKENAVLSLATEKGKGTAVQIRAIGANNNAEVIGETRQEGRSSYFTGNDRSRWHTDVPHYGTVRYRGIYPGIDQIYYGKQGQLEYDFIVAPGADPDQIKLQLDGIDQMKIDAAGDLVLKMNGGGELRQHRPVVYQEIDGERRSVEARFKVLGKRAIGFELGAYDTTHPLTIDPVLYYSTFLGGDALDAPRSIALDGDGDAYLTGETYSANFPTTPGAYKTTIGIAEVFVVKLNATGSALIYSTFLAGNIYGNYGRGIAVDASGNAYVTGSTEAETFPVTTGAFQTTHGGGIFDVFVTKLNDTGTDLIYSTFIGGRGDYDQGTDIKIDTKGNAYLTGITTSTNFPITAGAFQTAHRGGGTDTFVTKLNASGTALIYSTFVGGNGNELAEGIAVDKDDNAYLTGSTESTNFPTTAGAYQTNFKGVTDAFVVKLNPSGSAPIYSTFLGGNDEDQGRGIAVDNAGEAYLIGFTESTDYPTTSGAYQRVHAGGGADVCITKLNGTGTDLVYSTLFGGNGDDTGIGIAVDVAGNAYLTGATGSSNLPTTPDAYQATYGGKVDAYFAQLNMNGSVLVYSTYFGGNDYDFGENTAVDINGDVYLIGLTRSANYPTTPIALQRSFNGGDMDGFAMKFSDKVSPPEIRKAFGTSSVTVGIETTLTFSITNPNPNRTLTGIGFVDNLPSGIIVTDPVSIVGTCGPKTTIIPGGSLISLTDATLTAGATCTFRTTVKGTTVGTKTNITSAVTSSEAGDGNQATASIDVTPLAPLLTTNFGAPSVPINEQTAVIFEVKNPNATAMLTRVAFSDPLPAGIRVAKTSSGVGCSPGSSLTAVAGSSTITYSNGTLLPGETCRMSATIEGIAAGSWSNTTTAADSLEGGRGGRGFAILDVIAPPRLGMTISGITLKVGVKDLLAVSITNLNSHAPVTGVGVTVNMPLGIKVAPGTTGCGSGTLRVAAGGSSLTLTDAVVTPGATCLLRVPIEPTRAGTMLIQSTSVVSSNGGTGKAVALPVLVKPADKPL